MKASLHLRAIGQEQSVTVVEYHDDRGLVAITEAVMLMGLVALVAFGVMLRKWRDRHNRRVSIE